MMQEIKDEEDLERIRDSDSDWDIMSGSRVKKKNMDILNKKKLTQWEMDELFNEL